MPSNTTDNSQDIKNQNRNQYQYQLDSGSESAFIGSWGSSSSSFLNTSHGTSELDSNDTDSDDAGDEFIAELTRQMTDYMLQEDEDAVDDDVDVGKTPTPTCSVFEKSTSQEQTSNQSHEQKRSYADTLKKSIGGFQITPSYSPEQEIQLIQPEPIQTEPPIQLYQVENQPRVGRVRKGKTAESTQQIKHQNQKYVNGGKGYPVPAVMGPQVGSGMRAIFLGGLGSRNASSGTGVFLPRSATDATDHSRKKPGCSTVLVPTRVLQALEQHFNNMETLSPSNGSTQSRPDRNGERSKTQQKSQVEPQKSQVEPVPIDQPEMELPQEWIY